MAEGDVGAVVETWSFDLTQATVPKIIHVSGDVYVIVYRDVAGDGQLVTFEIDNTGDIILPAIERVEFETGNCNYPDIIHVHGDIFAIAYCGVDNDGWIATVSISTAGDISAAVIDSFEFESGSCTNLDIIHISGDVYAIVYEGTGTQGKVITLSIGGAGDISAVNIDSLVFIAGNCFDPKIVHVYGDIFAIVYKGVGDVGFLVTVDIDIGGDIGAAVIDSFEFDTVRGTLPVIIHVSGDIFAIAYSGVDTDGFLITVSISSVGDIGAAVTDSFEFETDYCAYPNILHISHEFFAIAFVGPGNDGFIVSVSISGAGAIGDPVIDSLEFETADCSEPFFIHVSDDIYCVAFTCTGLIGQLTTLDIETVIGGAARHELLMGIG